MDDFPVDIGFTCKNSADPQKQHNSVKILC